MSRPTLFDFASGPVVGAPGDGAQGACGGGCRGGRAVPPGGRGGVGACGTALAYEVAGLGEGVSVYDGSWGEWSTIAELTQIEPLSAISATRSPPSVAD